MSDEISNNPKEINRIPSPLISFSIDPDNKRGDSFYKLNMNHGECLGCLFEENKVHVWDHDNSRFFPVQLKGDITHGFQIEYDDNLLSEFQPTITLYQEIPITFKWPSDGHHRIDFITSNTWNPWDYYTGSVHDPKAKTTTVTVEKGFQGTLKYICVDHQSMGVGTVVVHDCSEKCPPTAELRESLWEKCEWNEIAGQVPNTCEKCSDNEIVVACEREISKNYPDNICQNCECLKGGNIEQTIDDYDDPRSNVLLEKFCFPCPKGQIQKDNNCVFCSTLGKKINADYTDCEECAGENCPDDSNPCYGNDVWIQIRNNDTISDHQRQIIGGKNPSIFECGTCSAGKKISELNTVSTQKEYVCTACPAGKYTDIAGSTECKECVEENTVANDDQTGCRLCGPGEYIDETKRFCRKCEKHTYSTSYNQTECTRCPERSFIYKEGSTENVCRQCVTGSMYNPINDTCECQEYFDDISSPSAEVMDYMFERYKTNNFGRYRVELSFDQICYVDMTTGGFKECSGNDVEMYFFFGRNFKIFVTDKAVMQDPRNCFVELVFTGVSGNRRNYVEPPFTLNTPTGFSTISYTSLMDQTQENNSLTDDQAPVTSSSGPTRNIYDLSDQKYYKLFVVDGAIHEMMDITTQKILWKLNCSGQVQEAKAFTNYIPLSQQNIWNTELTWCYHNLTCGKGKFVDSNQDWNEACTSCSAGKYQDEDMSTSCKDCPQNSWTTQLGTTNKLDCECNEGFFRGSDDECQSCAPGQFLNTTKNECESCAQGQYSLGKGETQCNTCPPFFYNNDTGSSTCFPCSAQATSPQCSSYLLSTVETRSFRVYLGTDKRPFTDCRLGMYSAFSDLNETQHSCNLECPVGTFSNQTGNISSCLSCEIGKFSDSSASTTCTACESGKISRPGSVSEENCIVSCSPGQYVNESDVCVSCDAGKYSPVIGYSLDSCMPCEAGKYAENYGTVECTECPLGTYSNQLGSSSYPCIQCGAGKSTPSLGISWESCTDCEAGKYALQAGSPSCTECEAGKYSTAVGSSIPCIECAVGKYTEATGSEFCWDCPPGQYADTTGHTQCKECGYDTWTSTSQTVTCTACAAGTFIHKYGEVTDSCHSTMFPDIQFEITPANAQPMRFESVDLNFDGSPMYISKIKKIFVTKETHPREYGYTTDFFIALHSKQKNYIVPYDDPNDPDFTDDDIWGIYKIKTGNGNCHPEYNFPQGWEADHSLGYKSLPGEIYDGAFYGGSSNYKILNQNGIEISCYYIIGSDNYQIHPESDYYATGSGSIFDASTWNQKDADNSGYTTITDANFFDKKEA